MRYCRFLTEQGPQYGQVTERAGALWVETVLAPPEEDLTVRPYSGKFTPRQLTDLALLAPVAPSKIVCIGRNYREHAAELGNEAPKEPLLFLKAPSALLAPGGVVRLPAASKRVDFEGELGIIIGRVCRKLVPNEDVRPYIRGYTIVNDVTARDLQQSDGQWSRAKGFDTFCPVGPIVTNEIDPDAGIMLTTRLNGAVKQHGTTADLIFNIATLLRYISSAMTLCPGDLISTGTPAGVGPMQPGDRVEVSIEGIGTLANSVEVEE